MPSRQRSYQLRNVASGLCQICPDPGVNGYCEKHRRNHNALRRTEAFKRRRREKYALRRLWDRPWIMFGLKKPYTAEDVRRALRKYITQFKLHTDVGGDKTLLQRFNRLAEKAIEAIGD